MQCGCGIRGRALKIAFSPAEGRYNHAMQRKTKAELEAAKTLLRERGLRATPSRLAVYIALSRAEGPLSHGDVASLLDDDGLDRATVYRNLIDLTEAKIVKKSDLGDHVWRFELVRESADHDGGLHAHFICGECGTVECLPEATIELHATQTSPKSLKKSAVEIQVRGTCDSCE
jgi:Fur family ferric uptake transcriptional regulator